MMENRNTRRDSTLKYHILVYIGTTSHIETSWYAFESVFKFIQEKLDQRLGAEVRVRGNQATAGGPGASVPFPKDTKIAASPAPNKSPAAAPSQVQEDDPMSQDPYTESTAMETETVQEGGEADRGVTIAARRLKQPPKAKSEL